MARSATDSTPITGPRPLDRPGVMHVERTQYGESLEVPTENPDRARKGDLGWNSLQPPKTRSPFRDLKKGR
jgi:hypothetical protein